MLVHVLHTSRLLESHDPPISMLKAVPSREAKSNSSGCEIVLVPADLMYVLLLLSEFILHL